MSGKIDSNTATQMKADYLMGKTVKQIATKYGYTVREVGALRTRKKWTQKAELLDAKVNLEVENQIIKERLRILEKLHAQSETIIDNAFSKLKDKDSFEKMDVYDSEGNVIEEKTNYRELKALADIWNLGFKRLLRSVGETDSVKTIDENQNNSGERPLVQVLLKVGIKNEVEVELTNGKKAKKSKA